MTVVDHVYLSYTCFKCQNDFSTCANLRRHLETQEGLPDLPSQKGRNYNTKFIKFISEIQMRAYVNPIIRYPCVSCKMYFEKLSDLPDHYEKCHRPQKHPELQKSYEKLSNKDKWVLSTGKIVEDALFTFSQKCLADHPSCSMIVYPEDDTLIDNGVFTEQELQEIQEKEPLKFISPIPPMLEKYINKFNKNSVADLRGAILETEEWETKYNLKEYFDLDWVKITVHSYVRLFESQVLEKHQLETWYDRKIWCLIDNAFDDLLSVQIIRGEAVSIANTLQKNRKRTIGSFESTQRLQLGKKCDLIVRETKAKHDEALEFGIGESGREYYGSKHLMEGNLTMPKIMKDMLDRLIINSKKYKGLVTFGVQTSGLSIILFAADRPTPYITRITKIQELAFPSNVSLFGQKVLPLIVLVWQFKQQIIKVQKELLKNNTKNDSSWLQDCLKSDICMSIIPTTSKSSEYISNKRAKF